MSTSVSIGPFFGINNRLPDREMQRFERVRPVGAFLRNAVNVDAGHGTYSRRRGIEQALEGGACHSLWSDEKASFFVDGSGLYQLTDQLGKTLVRSDMTPDLPLSYARVGDVVYWSNGIEIGKIANGVSTQVGPSVPNPPPTVSVDATGSLLSGMYQIAFSAVGTYGEESGLTWPDQVVVPDNGRISVSGLPGTAINVYLSPQNGDKLFLAGSTTAATYEIPVVPALGAQATTVGLRQLPAGQILRYRNGRMLSAAGAMLYFSEPFAPALHSPARGYIVFPQRITMVEPFEDGVWVVADKTYWLAGANIEQASLTEVLPYGAVEGTATRDIRENQVWWFSERGIVMVESGGRIRNQQEENVAVDSAAVGASVYRERNGMRQVVASLFGTEVTHAAATSFMEAEIIRKESMQ